MSLHFSFPSKMLILFSFLPCPYRFLPYLFIHVTLLNLPPLRTVQHLYISLHSLNFSIYFMSFLGSRNFCIHAEILHPVKSFMSTLRLPPNFKDLFASLVSATTIVMSHILWNVCCGSRFLRQLPVCHELDLTVVQILN